MAYKNYNKKLKQKRWRAQAKENTKAFCLVAEPVEVLQKIGFAFVGILVVGFNR